MSKEKRWDEELYFIPLKTSLGFIIWVALAASINESWLVNPIILPEVFHRLALLTYTLIITSTAVGMYIAGDITTWLIDKIVKKIDTKIKGEPPNE